MSDEIRVGESVEPVIQALPDDERRAAGNELRSLLFTCDPINMGESITDCIRGFEGWQNSQFAGGKTQVELVLEPMFLEHGGGTVSLYEVNISLRSKGGIGSDEFEKTVDGVRKAAQQVTEGRNTRRVAPTLKVEV